MMIVLMTLLSIQALFLLLILIFFYKDIRAIQERDPAAKCLCEIILLYSGLHALVFHRVAHFLWNIKIPVIPRMLSQMSRFLTGIEIHPGAVIGIGLFIDHGSGVVIGETTIIGDHVTLYQGVTLGGTGKEVGKRHPTLQNHIVIGSGAKVLGNITIGSHSYIGANAVVLKDVPSHSTIVGVPGHITKQDGSKIDKTLAHAEILDPMNEKIEALQKRIQELEKKI